MAQATVLAPRPCRQQLMRHKDWELCGLTTQRCTSYRTGLKLGFNGALQLIPGSNYTWIPLGVSTEKVGTPSSMYGASQLMKPPACGETFRKCT